MRRLALISVSLLAFSFAHADPAAGRYRLRLPEATARVALLGGKPLPKANLALRADGTFDLQVDSAIRHGRYRAEDANLVLTADGGDQFRGALKDGLVTLEGLDFERILPMNPVGVWTVRCNGVEDKGMRMEFKKDGTFRFAMTGASSEGTWTMVDGEIALVWTKVDGEAVEADTMKKSLPCDEDGASFGIDTFRYERATP